MFNLPDRISLRMKIYDINNNFGLLFGAAIRNVGFIYNVQDGTGTKKKFRNYDFGIPVGVKVGNMRKTFFFAGYEIEFPLNYKEKYLKMK